MKANRVLVLVVLLMTAVGFVAVAADAPAAPALGQPGSLMEVYGVIDAAARVSTDALTPSGGTYFGSSQGLFNGSRLGFRGTEALAGSFKAIYDLEIGVVLPYGFLDQQGSAAPVGALPTGVLGQLFGRQAWIGVSSDYGRLTFGRVYGTFSDALGVGDVFGTGHGNIGYNNGVSDNGSDAVNAFFLQEMGFRWDNSLKYEGSFSGFNVGAMASIGNAQGGEFLYNSMFAGSLGYSTKDFPVSLSVSAQTENDANNNNHLDVGGGLKYALDATDGIYAFYFHSAYAQGFTRISGNNSEISGTVAQARTDEIANVGANYYVTPALNLIASYYFDYAQNVAASGDNGMRNSLLVTADYYFTKDFDIYLGAWFSNFTGVLNNNKNGGIVANTDSSAGATFGGVGTAAGYFSNTYSAILGARFRF